MSNYKPGMLERLLIRLVVSKLGLKRLSGYKTYIVGALMIVQGLYSLATGETATYGNPNPVTQGDALEMIGIGSGFMSGRAGVAKLTTAVENGNGEGS